MGGGGVKEKVKIAVGKEMVKKVSELLKEFKDLKKREVNSGKIA